MSWVLTRAALAPPSQTRASTHSVRERLLRVRYGGSNPGMRHGGEDEG